MPLPHGNTAGCEKFIPADNLHLQLNIAAMAREIAPPLRNMKKIREDFRMNGYNDVAYDHNIPPLARNAVGYRNPFENRALQKNKTEQNAGRTTRKKFQTTEDFCVFCRNNGENPILYNSHRCKNERGLVSCPVLQALVCPYCKATGPVAHTIKYCPNKPIITPAYCEAMEQQKWKHQKYIVPQLRGVKEKRDDFRNNYQNDLEYDRNFPPLPKSAPYYKNPSKKPLKQKREYFRNNGHKNFAYKRSFPPLSKRAAHGYKNPPKKPLEGKTHKTSGRALRNEDQTRKHFCYYCFRYGHWCWDGRGLVCCPALQAIACHYCKATGKRAHTAKYCPKRIYDQQGTYDGKYNKAKKY
ncbi:AGAP006098-PA-like protein [Anopheles sinensis]|uniref:AGAP006098-PA-like protein n=1 Tax=Anopheles sinensis TaxID=74873 RepID=A0A084VIZ4_ANOSI|nr:AGAP006098-PA-like protein [Anopheles sinensis]